MDGGTAHGLEQLCVLRGAPSPVYKGGRGEEAGLGARQVGGVPLGLLVQFAPLSFYRKGFRAPPAKDMGLMGQEGKHTSHKGAGAPPPIWAGQIGEGKGKKERKKGIGFPVPPLPFLLRIGIGKGRPNWEDPK